MQPVVAMRLREPEHLVHVMIHLGPIRPSFPGSPQGFANQSGHDGNRGTGGTGDSNQLRSFVESYPTT